MGAGGERCVFAASDRADLPLLLARPGLALLGDDPLAVLGAGRGHAEPVAVLDRDLLTTELARPVRVAEFGWHTAPTLTGAPASTVRLLASRASLAAGPGTSCCPRPALYIINFSDRRRYDAMRRGRTRDAHEADVRVLDRDRLIGPRCAVALHVRVVAPVLTHAALVELRPLRGAVRVGGALPLASLRLDAVVREILRALPDKIDCGRLRGEKYFGAA